MTAGNIYYVRVAFSDGSGSKMRYTVEVGKNQFNTVYLDSITSKYEKKSSYIKLQYYPIVDWAEAGLKKMSYIDILSYFEKDEKIIMPQLTGKLTDRDLENLIKFIKSYPERLDAYKNREDLSKL